MKHLIRFVDDYRLDIITLLGMTQRISVHKGETYSVEMRPVVVETNRGFIEAVDITFIDGSHADQIMYETFEFYEA